MQWADIPFHPSDRKLRQFALLCVVFFCALGAWQGLGRARPGLGLVLAAVGIVLGLVGLWRPQWLRPVFVGWIVAVFPIGWIVSKIVLGVLFYVLFTLVAVIFRVMNRDVLNRRRRPGTESYWTPKAAPTDVRSYFRQS